MDRRHFLGGASAAAALASTRLGARNIATVTATGTDPLATGFATAAPLAVIQARADRIIALSVCTRPFRAQGPRIELERIGRKQVVHNYGHGGSGWSLSWGCAEQALRLAQAAGADTRLGVIGCGAIGLTTALLAQRAGLRVCIYAKQWPPEVDSFHATGVWSPDSRICSSEHATPQFRQHWQTMARFSFRQFQTLLGLPGDPVQWRDSYMLSDLPFDQAHTNRRRHEVDYPNLQRELLADLGPRATALTAGMHPFPVAHVQHQAQLTFNISTYCRLLMDEFLLAGGQRQTLQLESRRQFNDLHEKVLVNATGYGARALLGDHSLVPVRGQTARLVPQPEVTYGLNWLGHNLYVVPRRDGILVQAQARGDFGNADTTADRAASETAVATLAQLYT